MVVEGPTPDDVALAAAAEELGPEKSLSRAEEVGRFVFGNVAVVSTVLAAVGLTTDAGSAWDQGPHVFGVPLPTLLVAAGLVFSTLALMPSLQRLNLVDLEAVRRFYRWQIIRRGGCALLAMIALGAAIASAVAIAADQQRPSHALVVAASITGPSSRSAVTASATTGGLDGSDLLLISVYENPAGGRRALICTAVSGPTTAGAATVSCPTRELLQIASVTIDASVQRDGATLRHRHLVLRR